MLLRNFNNIGKSFTVNDDALANKIDDVIANNSDSINVIDNYSIGGINSKVVSDATTPITLYPPIGIAGTNYADTSGVVVPNNFADQTQTNFAEEQNYSNFANGINSNNYIIPTLNKKPDSSSYSNNMFGAYANITSPSFTNGLGFNVNNNTNIDQNLDNINNQPDRYEEVRDSLINKTIETESGYSDLKSDKGGKTNMGIAWETWQNFAQPTLGVEPTVENQKNISHEDAAKIYRVNYWDQYRIDEINNIDLRHLIFDIFVNNTGSAARMIQGVLKNDFNQNIEIDGVMGSKTIDIINSVDPNRFHERLLDARKQHYYNRVDANPDQKQFLNGWLNKRVNDFRK